ncbi:MAG: hypothetical protein C5B59_15595 [Bacteroidetes bacterium]|nr:MAG: hypothetical protein C5B59_15595 [Bacteroidota bacterium]
MAIASFSTYRKAGKWRQQILILYYGLKDSRSPYFSKIPAIAALVYLFSPIDLIPDFIPFAGYLDDLVIVPLLLQVSLRLLPPEVIESSRNKAIRQRKKINLALTIFGAVLLLTGAFLIWGVWKLFH